MRNHAKSIIGQRFGRWTIVQAGRLGNCGPRPIPVARCDCGTVKSVRYNDLHKGKSQSCGCLLVEVHTKHGLSRTAEYRAWKEMVHRCTDPRDASYANYGGRGIAIYPPWIHDVVAFCEYMGPKPSPSHMLDRISNDRGYFPGNLRWATLIESQNNRRNVRHLTLDGETLPLADWSRRVGIKQYVMHNRLRAGWTDREILTTPIAYRSPRPEGPKRAYA